MEEPQQQFFYAHLPDIFRRLIYLSAGVLYFLSSVVFGNDTNHKR